MIKEIVKDVEKLSQISEYADIKESDEIIKDLVDTAEFHKDNCVGLAAIQIGIPKRIIVVKMGEHFQAMINPKILKLSNQVYETEEGCLSVEGTRKVKRHTWVELLYTNSKGTRNKHKFAGYVAQIIQHEVDHCIGKII